MKIQTICKTLLSYCLKCRKNTEGKNSNVLRTKNGRIMLYQIVWCVMVKI